MNITWWKGLFLFFSVFVLTIIFERLLIPALRRRHAGQHILEIGPAWHKEKEGTPTMGGLGFMAAFLMAFTAFSPGKKPVFCHWRFCRFLRSFAARSDLWMIIANWLKGKTRD